MSARVFFGLAALGAAAAGAVVFGPAVAPALARAAKPAAKTAAKTAAILAERMSEAVAEVIEIVEDAYAEAEAELAEGRTGSARNQADHSPMVCASSTICANFLKPVYDLKMSAKLSLPIQNCHFSPSATYKFTV